LQRKIFTINYAFFLKLSSDVKLHQLHDAVTIMCNMSVVHITVLLHSMHY
jgi:hypothetical protein